MQEAPTSAEESKLAKQVNEEYHDPFDDWSARDFLLSLVPFIVVFAFKDSALNAALAFGIAWSGLTLLLRLTSWDGRHKIIWPVLDIASFITLAILRGFTRRWYYWIHKWIPVIFPLVLAVTGIASLLWRRPFTAHYARYPKFDRGGRGLWHGDASFRRTADLTMIGWIAAWSIMLLLSLIPILVGFWFTWHALNTIFNYIVPFVLLAGALIYHQIMGSWYRSSAGKHAPTSLPGRGATSQLAPAGVAQPAGTADTLGGTGTAVPTTYSSTAV